MGDAGIYIGENKNNQATQVTPAQDNVLAAPGEDKPISKKAEVISAEPQFTPEAFHNLQSELLMLKQREATLGEEARKARQALKDAEAKIAQDSEKLKRAEALEYEMAVVGMAGKHNVDPASLKAAGITDLAQLEKVAVLLPKKSAMPVPDSGKNIGGRSFNDMPPEEKMRYGMEHPEAKM